MVTGKPTVNTVRASPLGICWSLRAPFNKSWYPVIAADSCIDSFNVSSDDWPMVGTARVVAAGLAVEGASDVVAVVVPGVVAVGLPVLENGATPGAGENVLIDGVDGPAP